METKVCHSCGVEKPATAEHYYRNKENKDGLLNNCKSCQRLLYVSKKVYAIIPNTEKDMSITGVKTCTSCGQEKPATAEYYCKAKTGTRVFMPFCKECQSARNKVYRLIHRDKVNAQSAQYYIDNKTAIRAQKKEYGKRNQERLSEYRKQYYEDHKEIISERAKQYALKNQDKIAVKRKLYYSDNKQRILNRVHQYYVEHIENYKVSGVLYRISHPNQGKLSNHKRAALRREYPATFTRVQWEEAKTYFNNRCAYCGKEKELTQDHFIPLAKGGAYTRENIIPACKWCNFSKHDKLFQEWYPSQKIYSKKREQFITKYILDKYIGAQISFAEL